MGHVSGRPFDFLPFPDQVPDRFEHSEPSSASDFLTASLPEEVATLKHAAVHLHQQEGLAHRRPGSVRGRGSQLSRTKCRTVDDERERWRIW